MSAILDMLFLGFFRIKSCFVFFVLRPICCRDQDQILRSLRVALVCFDQEFFYKLKSPRWYM